MRSEGIEKPLAPGAGEGAGPAGAGSPAGSPRQEPRAGGMSPELLRMAREVRAKAEKMRERAREIRDLASDARRALKEMHRLLLAEEAAAVSDSDWVALDACLSRALRGAAMVAEAMEGVEEVAGRLAGVGADG